MNNLSVKEVAEILDCTPETVELKTRQGFLPGLQYGRSWIFPERALENILVEQSILNMRDRLSRGLAETHPATAAVMDLKPVPGRQFGPLRAVPPVLPSAPELT